MGVSLDLERQKTHQFCSFMWADNHWVMSHSRAHLEQVLKDLIQEARRQDFEPKPAGLLWISACDSKEKIQISIETKTGCHRFPFEELFKILGCTMNRQAANKAWWRDAKIYRSKDVSWRERCRRMVEHVCNVFCLGNENWSGSRATMDRIRKWETKAMRRVFRFKKEEDETWANYCTRAATVAKKIAPTACGSNGMGL